MLLADLRNVILAAGQTNRQLAAQPERGVVPPVEPDRDNRPATSRAATSAVISSLSITAIMPRMAI
jgi:hypothetical protein